MSERPVSFVIAIDGPVAAGKDTVSDWVAEQLQTIHVNSGALYRMWTYLADGRSAEELEPQVPQLIEKHIFRLERRERKVHYILDEEDITDKLYTNDIHTKVAQISMIKAIREHVNSVIRQFAGQSSLIIDGRDATTVIFPDADLKVYLDTAFEVRVQRRLEQLHQKGDHITFEVLADQMQERDERDMNKGIYSLTKTNDAFYVDATGLTPEEAAQKIVEEFEKRVL